MRQRKIRAVAAVTALTMLAACSDARLDKLALGISADSASQLIGAAPHRTSSYLTGPASSGLYSSTPGAAPTRRIRFRGGR